MASDESDEDVDQSLLRSFNESSTEPNTSAGFPTQDVNLASLNASSPESENSTGLPTQNNNEETTPLELKFGEIKFGDSEKVIKVVKIAAIFEGGDKEEKSKFLKQTGENLLKQLEKEEEWKWTGDNRPNLLISVTGGAWDFPFNTNIKEVFRKGIVEAAESAKAWVITGGTNVGVMKYVGTAVGDYETAKKNGKKKIETIGIAVFGKLRLDYRDEIDLALKKGCVGELDPGPPAESAEKEVSSLEPNHSYFILVDDGTDKYGSDVPLRGGLEKAMSENWKVSDLEEKIPVVCIVVEGGPNTIQQAKEAVLNKIPILVVANSGRASNIMAAAFYRPDTSDTCQNGDSEPDASKTNNVNWEKDIKKRLEIISSETDVQNRCFKDIKAMMESEREMFLNVYVETSKIQIDQMILKALIKAKKEERLVQLQLAQTWNRRDIVEYSEILGHVTETTDWKNYKKNTEKFKENLRTALVNNQFEFVQMFLENNIVQLETYLTKGELANLYIKTNVTKDKGDQTGNITLHPLLEGTHWDNRKTIDDDDDHDGNNDNDCPGMISIIGTCFSQVLEMQNQICSKCCSCGNDNEDDAETKVLHDIEAILQDLIAPAFTLIADGKSEEKDKKITPEEDYLRDPHRQLFLFAILNKYYKMAEFFWEQGQEHIAAALAASAVFRKVAKSQNSELKENLQIRANGYEDKACKVLAECEDQSEQDDTKYILINPTRNWGFVNPLKLADLSESRIFIAEPTVQRLLNTIWSDGLKKEGKIYEPNTESNCLGMCGKPFKKDIETVQRFFTPEKRFYLNVVFYVVFLAYFSWIMVSDKMNTSAISVAEIFLIFWVFTFIMEEIRQALPQPFDFFGERPEMMSCQKWRPNFWDQFKLYIKNVWNYIDMTMLFFFVIGEMARSDPNTARIFLAFSLVLFYLRFLRILTVIRSIGPKVLMIFKTLNDFKTMVLILLIVLVGYGTAVHAVLYPHVSDPLEVARGIFFRPLFQIYGNLFLEDLTATETSGMCTNNMTEMHTGYKQACPENVAWGVVFLVMYMILSNVLLLNIFIAMFSIACENIHREAEIHWASQIFHITEEYYNRP
ncbi:transient receptor potential cation channel subfamily M member-like 2 [Amphiura filiformis]|uniref:transient receptor potential cation channel subfamily M member-like 2 n=1 Tax=Amphiura filiformis TaxID=82378 RepID=UPI003B20B9DE